MAVSQTYTTGSTVGPSAHKFRVAIRWYTDYSDGKDSRCSTIDVDYLECVEMLASTSNASTGQLSKNFTVSWSSGTKSLPPSAYTASDSSTYYAYGATRTSLKTKWTGGTQTITKARSCYYNYSTTGQYKSTIAANTTTEFTRWVFTLNANGGTFSNGATTLKTYRFLKKTYVLPATANDSSYSVKAVPTRTGYKFLGWATTATATTAAYQQGANVSNAPQAATTYYAVWQPLTYTITYDANGGEGAPAAQTKMHDVALILSSDMPTKSGYKFGGWARSETASVPEFFPGGDFTLNETITLYAFWDESVENYIKVSGVYKQITDSYIKINGVYKKCILTSKKDGKYIW